jgi:hypothetical protein
LQDVHQRLIRNGGKFHVNSTAVSGETRLATMLVQSLDQVATK